MEAMEAMEDYLHFPASPMLPPGMSDIQRKPRCDSKLKTLPPEQQATLIEWLDGPLGLQGARRLAQEKLGLQTSLTALSHFYSWWHLRRHLQLADSFLAHSLATLPHLPNLHLREEQINLAAQIVFELDALKRRDFNAFYRLRRLRQQDRLYWDEVQARREQKQQQQADQLAHHRDLHDFMQWYTKAQRPQSPRRSRSQTPHPPAPAPQTPRPNLPVNSHANVSHS